MQVKNKLFSEVFTKQTIELKIVTFLAAQSLLLSWRTIAESQFPLLSIEELQRKPFLQTSAQI